MIVLMEALMYQFEYVVYFCLMPYTNNHRFMTT